MVNVNSSKDCVLTSDERLLLINTLNSLSTDFESLSREQLILKRALEQKTKQLNECEQQFTKTLEEQSEKNSTKMVSLSKERDELKKEVDKANSKIINLEAVLKITKGEVEKGKEKLKIIKEKQEKEVALRIKREKEAKSAKDSAEKATQQLEIAKMKIKTLEEKQKAASKLAEKALAAKNREIAKLKERSWLGKQLIVIRTTSITMLAPLYDYLMPKGNHTSNLLEKGH